MAYPSLRQVFEEHGEFGGKGAVCPHCGVYTTFDNDRVFGLEGLRVHMGVATSSIYVAQCRSCSSGVIGARNHVQERRRPRGALVYPSKVGWPDRAPEGLDEAIKRAYDEARAVAGISPMATAVLARRCIQHLVRVCMSITKPRLFDEIEEAVKREELSRSTKNALHHVRKIGNWGAHPANEADTIVEVTPGEAAYTLEAVEMLFDDLYVMPAKIAEMEKRINGS